MGKRILGVVVFFLALGLLWYAYQRHQLTQANDGDVTTDDSGPKVTETVADMPVVKNAVTPIATPPAPATPPAASAATPTAVPTVGAATVPAADSIAPNPANGMAFAGNGKFQVYRQGNLTWRVDTESGRTCILFATMEEWKKPLVFQHGCANS